MGIVTYALGLHQKQNWGGRYQELSPAMALLEESHRLGASGIMVDLNSKDAPVIDQLRHRAEQYGMYIEASIMPPKSAEDVARFESDVRLSQAAGATLARTVLFPGRRYEQFKSMDDFREYGKRAEQALQWAAPVLSRNKFHLALENHKDQRVPEKLALLQRIGNEFVGICLDVGNSFTLLEDPLEVVRGYAPYTLTVHLKDQAVRENETGFLFADVPMGKGFLSLPEIVQIFRQAKPHAHFGLELITRDALNVPVLTPGYWTTLSDLPATELARTLRTIRAHQTPEPFESVSALSPAKQMELETRNLQESIAYDCARLDLKA